MSRKGQLASGETVAFPDGVLGMCTSKSVMPPVVLCIVVSYVSGEIALRFMGRRLNRTVGLVRFSVSVVSSRITFHT